MNGTTIDPNGYSSREKKTSMHAAFWYLAWALSVTLGGAGAALLPESKLLVGIVALFINLGICLAAIKANVRMFKTLDEMQRKIQLESLAMAFASLWIAIGCLLILSSAELIDIGRWEVSLLAGISGLVLAIGNVVGILRHR